MIDLSPYIFPLMFLIPLSYSMNTEKGPDEPCDLALVRKHDYILRPSKDTKNGTYKSVTECEDEISEHEHQHNRSICPWICQMNYNARRHPQLIIEKVCEKELEPGIQNACKGISSDRYYCGEITTVIPVLQFVKRCGKFDLYRKETIKVSTGCSCVKAT